MELGLGDANSSDGQPPREAAGSAARAQGGAGLEEGHDADFEADAQQRPRMPRVEGDGHRGA
eukprot:2932680-Alexandrium_andersonii.AAC.1